MFVVTGGAGLIGSALVWKLNQAGIDDIWIVDHLGKGEKWKNLTGLRYADYVSREEFLARVETDRLPPNVDGIVHMGACSATTERDADYLMANNYGYTCALAEWCAAKDVRFVYASSAATYGDGALGFSDDDALMPALRPLNMYGYSKHLFDLYALRTGLIDRVAGVKFFNVFGPNEYHKGGMTSVPLNAFRQISETGALKLFRSYKPEFADGEQKRDFVYVKDAVDVLFWLLRNPVVNGVYNLGTGLSRSWNDLARAVFSAMGKPEAIEYIDMPPALVGKYQYFTEADMGKLRAMGCDVSFRTLEESVDDYVTNYLARDFGHLDSL